MQRFCDASTQKILCAGGAELMPFWSIGLETQWKHKHMKSKHGSLMVFGEDLDTKGETERQSEAEGCIN